MKTHKLLSTNKVGQLFALALTIIFGFQFTFGQTDKLDIRELKPNQTIEREMTGKQTHHYKFDLQKDEFFQVRVEQKEVDVMLKFLDAKDNVLATMDSPNEDKGFEILSYVTTKTGNYKLEVSGFDEKAKKGIYTIRRERS